MLKTIDELSAFFQKEDEFTAAIEYTRSQFNFSAELVEKDYLCSLLLMYLYQNREIPIVFKGGTLLAKVHAGFYRMSEDLDFTIPMSPDVKRKERSACVKPLKEVINSISKDFEFFTINKSLTGSNASRQYNAEIIYDSKFGIKQSKILIEIGLRETCFEQPLIKIANTLLINPFSGDAVFPNYKVKCLTLSEAYAEKIRAALSREKLAIRDFYDLYYARQNNIFDFTGAGFIGLVRKKLALPNTKLVEFDS